MTVLDPVLDPVRELEAINRALVMCEDALRGGDHIDLTGVDEQVAMLCGEVVKSEGPLRLQLLPLLESAVQTLERLEAALRQTMQQEKDGATAVQRVRAGAAYGGPPAAAPPEPAAPVSESGKTRSGRTL